MGYVSAPKATAKDPINLDAIIVCKKGIVGYLELDNQITLWQKSQTEYKQLCQRLEAVGRSLSEGDKRVIMIASFLNQCSRYSLSYEQVSELLKNMELKDLIDYMPKNTYSKAKINEEEFSLMSINR